MPLAAQAEEAGSAFDIGAARAHWLGAGTLAWDVPADSTVRLHYSVAARLDAAADGVAGGAAITLQRDGAIDGASGEKFRHLAGLPAYRIAGADLPLVTQILKQQFAVSAADVNGALVAATGVQPAGVLDDLFTYQGDLGVTFADGVPTLRLWAPTARSVKLHLFAGAGEADDKQVFAMREDAATGTWFVVGQADWNRKYYLYEVEVYVRTTGKIERNLVTDPYAVSLSMDSARTQIVNLDDADLKPRGWNRLRKPPLAAPEDIALYELHIRDFSIGDDKVPKSQRGTFRAFAQSSSRGMRHLRELGRAGLTHVHILPAFDCATIPEDRGAQLRTGDLARFEPYAKAQQAAVAGIRANDGFNWCYDPYHYTTPEGSYATDPNGVARIREFREMVAGLNRARLRVVMDVVYNHTTASGQAARSVLDKIVPDYYQRLNAAGEVETSTCCANTATEHAMMEKLMLDSLRVWATEYRVDGFRFDLMGHHTRANMLRARDELRSLTVAADGVDGAAIYLYGEGWNFGEVVNDARFVQATQRNMGTGTGIGAFNDRLRDGLRGGWPFDTGVEQVRRQGFVNGLFYAPNHENDGGKDELNELLQLTDWIRVGLAGSLAGYEFVDRAGAVVRGADVDYRGQPAGFTSDPQEAINYAAAHDNETLFDSNQYKLPRSSSRAERVRAQNLATSVIALSQGVPFFHAGQDMLRSKSLDRNSFDSGDWFNPLDFSYRDNGWGRGLPPGEENQRNWPVARSLLENPDLAVGRDEIRAAVKHLREMLRIRTSSDLFRLRSAEDIISRLAFHNTGPDQVPGLIVMSLRGERGIEIVVFFNAGTTAQAYQVAAAGEGDFRLHPVQRRSADRIVRAAVYRDDSRRFYVPARTTAVFLRR